MNVLMFVNSRVFGIDVNDKEDTVAMVPFANMFNHKH